MRNPPSLAGNSSLAEGAKSGGGDSAKVKFRNTDPTHMNSQSSLIGGQQEAVLASLESSSQQEGQFPPVTVETVPSVSQKTEKKEGPSPSPPPSPSQERDSEAEHGDEAEW